MRGQPSGPLGPANWAAAGAADAAAFVDGGSGLGDKAGGVGARLEGEFEHAEDVGAQDLADSQLRPRVGVEASATRTDDELGYALRVGGTVESNRHNALVVVGVGCQEQLDTVLIGGAANSGPVSGCGWFAPPNPG